MKVKQWLLSLAAGLLVIIGLNSGHLNFGGAGGKILRHFPRAEVFFDPLNSPDPSFPMFTRLVFPGYVDRSEPVGMRLADHPAPVDLAVLGGLRLHTVSLTRCKIADLQSIEAAGLHPVIHFTDCDFSELPPEQRHLVRPYDPKNPAAGNQFSYEPLGNLLPGFDPL